ncbi:MAG TPA: 5-formyltetrahydrofolate cyclo-ligase, partial [Sphingopyxis sp.]|nr:5-formyltetrahydrofolate cyclo-ligase [Sphingopyxis sp.]
FAAYPDALRIGVGWSVQEVDAVPAEPTDVALDAVLTEQEYIITGERL